MDFLKACQEEETRGAYLTSGRDGGGGVGLVTQASEGPFLAISQPVFAHFAAFF